MRCPHKLTTEADPVDGPFGADDGHLPALATPAASDPTVELLRVILAAVTAGPPELLGRDPTSRFLGICARTLDRLAAEPGRIPEPVKLGTRVLWRRRDLVKWVESGCKSMRGRATC
jgi:predicted DNA-binding transcriptional regulator AlpA